MLSHQPAHMAEVLLAQVVEPPPGLVGSLLDVTPPSPISPPGGCDATPGLPRADGRGCLVVKLRSGRIVERHCVRLPPPLTGVTMFAFKVA